MLVRGQGPHLTILDGDNTLVDAAAVTSVAASPTTSVVVLDVEHHILVRIVVQGEDEAVGGVVPDRIVVRRRHKISLGWVGRLDYTAHKVSGSCGRVNQSANLGGNGLAGAPWQGVVSQMFRQ